jgi:hypothetical protein
LFRPGLPPGAGATVELVVEVVDDGTEVVDVVVVEVVVGATVVVVARTVVVVDGGTSVGVAGGTHDPTGTCKTVPGCNPTVYHGFAACNAWNCPFTLSGHSRAATVHSPSPARTET